MRLAFLVERPTQFEAPFFRHAAADPRHELRVLFTGADVAEPVFDPELGRPVSWGIDLLGGYPHAVLPARGRMRWLARELRRGSCDLLIVNGYTRRDYLAAAWLARRQGIATALRLDSVVWDDNESRDGGSGTGGGNRGQRRQGDDRGLRGQDHGRGQHGLSDGGERRQDGGDPGQGGPGEGEGGRAGATARGRGGERARQAARRWLVSLLLTRLYDLFLGVGSLTLDYLTACGVPAARQGLFPYAVDVEHFRAASSLTAAERLAARERLGLPPGARAVLAVAKLNPRETPWDLLRALPRLAPDVHLVVAGDGPDRATAERLGAELAPGRVRWLGYVAYGELPALYAAADLFVHAPSGEERWGVSVAEALACGLPAVTSSRVGAARDLLVTGTPAHTRVAKLTASSNGAPDTLSGAEAGLSSEPGEAEGSARLDRAHGANGAIGAIGANGAVYPAGDAAALARAAAAALALDRAAVAAVNRAVLARWDYAASWRRLLDAAGRIVGGSAP